MQVVPSDGHVISRLYDNFILPNEPKHNGRMKTKDPAMAEYLWKKNGVLWQGREEEGSEFKA